MAVLQPQDRARAEGLAGETDLDFLLNYPDFTVFDLDPYIYSG